MNELQTTLELINLDSGDDEIDPEFERELLENLTSTVNPSLSNDQQIDQKSSLDDRLVRMEYDILEQRIHALVINNVPFGPSGMVASAVAFKDLTPLEAQQLQTSAIAISSFTNLLIDKLNNPNFMGLVTISLVTDDLYQDRFFLFY